MIITLSLVMLFGGCILVLVGLGGKVYLNRDVFNNEMMRCQGIQTVAYGS